MKNNYIIFRKAQKAACGSRAAVCPPAELHFAIDWKFCAFRETWAFCA